MGAAKSDVHKTSKFTFKYPNCVSIRARWNLIIFGSLSLTMSGKRCNMKIKRLIVDALTCYQAIV